MEPVDTFGSPFEWVCSHLGGGLAFYLIVYLASWSMGLPLVRLVFRKAK